MLSKYERNEIFELIQDSELALADFEPPQEGTSGQTVIRHLLTDSSLTIGEREKNTAGRRTFWIQTGRVVGTRLGDDSSVLVGEDLLSGVKTWLDDVARRLAELERDRSTPDLWAEFAREREALSGSVPELVDNTPFTASEQAEIETRLREVATYAAESGKYADDELQTLNAKIDYLIESSKHSRRFDWREQMVGAFLSAVVGNVLPQSATMDVLNMLVGTVGHLIGHPVLGLPG